MLLKEVRSLSADRQAITDCPVQARSIGIGTGKHNKKISLPENFFTTFAFVNKARKMIAGLLAIYLLILFFMPCNEICASGQHQEPITFQSAQDHHQKDNDICSPFCHCSCCSTLVTIVHQSELKIFIQTGIKEFSLLMQSFVSTFADDCWQPPRIA
jgi:uncharacterized protein DUF6660